jgi:hypothetical protein
MANKPPSSEFPPVNLPSSVSDFSKTFRSNGLDKMILRLSGDFSPANPIEETILKYSGNALKIGRPLDSAMIFMLGQSGSGKSSTINVLFDDPHLCSTSSKRSQTKEVTTITKRLEVTKSKPGIIGNITFIDVPGLFDTDARNEVTNLASIEKFRKNCPALSSRSLAAQLCSEYRGRFGPESDNHVSVKVYPNLVLLVVSAADKRLDGPESFFAKSLAVFKTLDLIDMQRPNLVIAVTHVMTFGSNKKKFTSNVNKCKNTIENIIFRELGVRNVPISVIENHPEDFDLELDPASQFRFLPNGERSHYNLIKVMFDRLTMNRDILGKLFLSWYFHPKCPDRKKKAEVMVAAGAFQEIGLHLVPTETELKEARDRLAKLTIVQNLDENNNGVSNMTPKLNFQ